MCFKVCKGLIFLFFFNSFLFAHTITSEQINDAFVTSFKNTWPQYQDARVAASVVVKDYQKKYFQVDSSEADVKVVINSRKNLSPVMYAPIRIFTEGKLRDVIRCRFQVAVFKNVYHAKKKYLKNTKISSDMLYLKEVDVLKYSQKLIDENFNFKGKVLISALKPDEPIKDWKFKKKPLVEVGEVISVVFIKDKIKINTTAKVLQQGYLGDKIRVRIVKTGKVFFAEVVDRDTFIVQL